MFRRLNFGTKFGEYRLYRRKRKTHVGIRKNSKPLLALILLILSAEYSFAAKAIAVLESKSKSRVTGTVEFTDTPNGLQIEYSVKGLDPHRSHGFHVHEKGDCSASDASSAGTHYKVIAPTGGTSLDTPQKYAGDLPPIVSDDDGTAKAQIVVQQLSIDNVNPVVDRAIVIHGGPDDPKKKSPPRIACGVIRKE